MIRIDWKGKRELERYKKAAKKISEDGAKLVLADMRRNLTSGSGNSAVARSGQSGILGALEIKPSKFSDSMHIVGVFFKGGKWADSFLGQAYFLEFGHAKPFDLKGPKVVPPHPFMRPAKDKNNKKIFNLFKKGLE